MNLFKKEEPKQYESNGHHTRFFLILICLLVSAGLSAQNLTKRTYEGALDGKIPIVLTLTQDGSSLFGTVVYKKKGIPITAVGSLTDGNMFLRELMNDGRVTGLYSLEPQGKGWTGTWGDLKRKGKDYKVTLREIAETTVQKKKLPNLTGTYAYAYPEDGGTGSISVLQTEPGKITIDVDAVRGGPSYNMAEIGKTNIPLKGNKAIYENNEYGKCKLQFTFGENVLEVDYLDEAYECGFGNGASAAGSYVRTKASQPTFE